MRPAPSLIYTLSLHDALPISDFTKTMIDAAVRDLRQAASFQFISLNDENGQYYINIDESIPVDELISQRGEMLSDDRSEEHTSELQSRGHLVCRLLLEKKKKR